MAHPGYRDAKKSEDQKSRAFRFRLHPQSEDQAEVGLHRELSARLNGRGNIRQYLIDLYRKAEKMPERDKPMPVIDTRKIMDKLDKIMSRLKGMPAANANTVQTSSETEYDDDFLSSLDRILDAGLAANNEELEYYDEED